MYQLVAALLTCSFAATATAWELNQQPSAPGEWGFRPTAETAVESNPPAFTWRPDRKATTYQIQIGRDAELQDLVYEAETQWSSHCPPLSLPPGELMWRYRALRGDQAPSEWSVVRQFTIPAAAVSYPQPPVKDLRSRLPEERPRMFMRPENLSHYRELAHGDLKAQWQAIQKTADELIATPPDVSEPPKYPKGMVRKSGEWKKIWWGNRLRAIAVADGAATLAFAYRISGEERYGRAARDLLLALTEWDPEGATSFAYNDEAAMPILNMASRAYDWAYPVLDEDDRTRIIAMQRIRGRQCFEHLTARHHLWQPYGSHQNRAWHKLAELATAFIDDIPEAETWLDYAMTVYFTCYPVWNDADGGWHEGLSYWNSYISRFTQWAFVMRQAYQIDAFQRPYFDRAGYFPMYLMPPGATHGGFGDLAPRMTSQSVSELVNLLASASANPHWKWYAEQHDAKHPSTYLGFFAAAEGHELSAQSPADLPTSIAFTGTGVAALNTNLASAADNVQILFKSSPFGTISHGHNSQNTFHLSVGGKPLLQNTGNRDAYGSPHHQQWMWHAQSQNVILVDGEGATSDRSKAIGRLTHFRTSDAVDVVAGEAGDAYPQLDRWGRRIIFLKPDVFVIHDVIRAKRPATFQYLLHAPAKFALDPPRLASVQADDARVDIEFLHPSDLKITQTDKYNPPPAEWANFELHEWHMTAATPAKSERQEFLTLFRVNGQKVQCEHDESDDGHELSVTVGDAKYRLILTERKFEVRYGTVDWSFED